MVAGGSRRVVRRCSRGHFHADALEPAGMRTDSQVAAQVCFHRHCGRGSAAVPWGPHDIFGLRENLTPLPHPKERGRLIVTGAYRWVRHPIYSGIIFSAFGFGLLMQCSLTLCSATLVFLFFEVKTRKEEQWLTDKYPEYAAYRKRVKRLIPFIH